MMGVAVTGAKGQASTALVEKSGPKVEILALNRPAFSLEDRDSVLAAIKAARPDVVSTPPPTPPWTGPSPRRISPCG